MADQGPKGLKRVITAFHYSRKGLAAAWQNEAAFREETIGALVMIPLGLWLGDNGVERALLVSSMLLVLLTELVNSAIEATVDRFGGEIHPLSGRAKDIGSAAVFMSFVIMGTVWLCVLW